MAAEAARDMGQDRMAVFKFNGEGRARENLFDRTKEFERRLLRGFGYRTGPDIRCPGSYDRVTLQDIISPLYPIARRQPKD